MQELETISTEIVALYAKWENLYIYVSGSLNYEFGSSEPDDIANKWWHIIINGIKAAF